MSLLMQILSWPFRTFHAGIVAIANALGTPEPSAIFFIYLAVLYVAHYLYGLLPAGFLVRLRPVPEWWMPTAWAERAHARKIARLDRAASLLEKQQRLDALRPVAPAKPDEDEQAFQAEMRRLDQELSLLGKRQELVKAQPLSRKRTAELADLDHQIAVLTKQQEHAELKSKLDKLTPKPPPPPVDPKVETLEEAAKKATRQEAKDAALALYERKRREAVAGLDQGSDEYNRRWTRWSRFIEEEMKK